MKVWPQFRSPLVWDAFAVSTYFTVSLLFWYVGLIPDMATLRDKARNRFAKSLMGCWPWAGADRRADWRRHEVAYLILAGLATPLVVSVHTVVSFDFCVANLPGWHSTIFPPYFVAGAIYSGFAMVVVLAIPLRYFYGLQDFITDHHLQNMAKVMLATCMLVTYGYAIEAFMAWYSANPYEAYVQYNRMSGPYAWSYWLLLACNVAIPQVLWSKRARVAYRYCLGWHGRVSGHVARAIRHRCYQFARDFLPSSWGMYSPTFWDWATLLGSLGLFFCLLFLFVRLLPAISMSEMRELVEETERSGCHRLTTGRSFL